ncbi:MAG: alginate lyase family protein [Terriglobia bacterium]
MGKGKRQSGVLARVARMGRDELRTRAAQEFAKRWDALLHALGYKFAGDIPAPAQQTAASFFFEPADLPDLASLVRERLPAEADAIVEEAERISRHRFNLLGYTDLDYGQEIDWHLDAVHGKRAPFKRWHRIRYLDFNEVGDHKITWELNRHQHLVTLAKAWRLTGQDQFAEELFRQWYSWQKANPYPVGINWASSLEVAFRSVSWIWVQHLLAGGAAAPVNFERDLLRALRLNGQHISRYLSTYFSPNTHLLGEGVGLFFIGTLYPQIPESRLWQQTGWEIILQAAERQVRPDGLHFEQSIYYHVYALDFFLHSRLLAASNGIPIPRTFDQKIERMLEVLRALGQGGPPPRIGDDDGGRVFNPRRNLAEHMLDPLATGAVIFGRRGFKEGVGGLREETIWLLGREGVAKFDEIQMAPGPPVSAQLGFSGIYLMAGTEASPRRLVVVAGPQEGLSCGHAHADALSVQLAVNGREWLIDPGSGCYVGEKGQRHYFRGTAAHSTMRVDGLDQGEMGGPFSWGSPLSARVDQWVSGKTFDLFSGSHTGYARLPQPVVHGRSVLGIKDRFWLVRDWARGTGEHQIDLSWHLAPGFLPRCTGENPAVLWIRNDEGLVLLPVEGHGWSQQISQGKDAPVYGRIQPSHVLSFRTEARLPIDFAVMILPVETADPQFGALERMDNSTEEMTLRAYRYARSDEMHFLFFAAPGQRWELGSWASDAQLLYCGALGEGKQHWVLCGGSYAEVGGRRVIECKQMVERFEWWNTGDREETSCSDLSSVNPVSAVGLAAAEMAFLGQGMGEPGGRMK